MKTYKVSEQPSLPPKSSDVDKILNDIRIYLVNAGWVRTYLFYIDPLTKAKHNSVTAVSIQIERDLQQNFGDL